MTIEGERGEDTDSRSIVVPIKSDFAKFPSSNGPVAHPPGLAPTGAPPQSSQNVLRASLSQAEVKKVSRCPFICMPLLMSNVERIFMLTVYFLFHFLVIDFRWPFSFLYFICMSFLKMKETSLFPVTFKSFPSLSFVFSLGLWYIFTPKIPVHIQSNLSVFSSTAPGFWALLSKAFLSPGVWIQSFILPEFLSFLFLHLTLWSIWNWY